ncbi:CHC2 zinc finger domain-containing protein [Terrimonas alba]|uniref:CHC2 zinc finger domain-containing protein n=1 Tax=Terrimonas alba TaxID=3349636 RepID=UPI0035F3D500
MTTRNISITEAKQIDMIDFLKSLGHTPQKIRNNDHWYLSPLREEKSPSFKVNRQLNVWYDHGTGEGGNLIDFGIRYFKCSVTELLQKLSLQQSPGFSFHPHSYQPAGEKKKPSHEAGKIRIINSWEISNPALQEYLDARQIPLAIANQFCEEVSFELYGKKHLAIGFKNDNGGYELRNQYFKGSSTPKEPRLIPQNGNKDLAVFEGFFSFLSFQTIQQSDMKVLIDLPTIQADSLVLNSVSFFEKSRERMEQYSNIHLLLDRDRMGVKCTQQALQWSSKYKDQSRHYHRFKDLNDCLIKSVSPELKQSHRRGRHL